MKEKRGILCGVLMMCSVFFAALGLAACDFGGGSSDEDPVYHWDDVYHWEAELEDLNPDIIFMQRQRHTFENNVCTVCGFAPDYTAGLAYRDSSDGYSVGGVGSSTDTEIVIPETYNGKPVTGIAEMRNKNITSVLIPKTVKTIYDDAFLGSEKLEHVIFAEGSAIETLGEEGGANNGMGAFAGTSVKEFIAPDHLKVLNMALFYNKKDFGWTDDNGEYHNEYYTIDAPSIESLTLPATLEQIVGKMYVNGTDEQIFSPGSLLKVNFKGTIEAWCAIDRAIPSFGEMMMSYSYYGVGYGLTEETMTIPRPVELTIGGKSVKQLTIPDGVTEINPAAFAGTDVEEVVIPGSVTKIGKGVFAGCSHIRKVTLPFITSDGIKVWFPDEVYDRTAGVAGRIYPHFEEITVTGGKTIPAMAFDTIHSLKKVTLGEGIEEIGESACSGKHNRTRYNEWFKGFPYFDTLRKLYDEHADYFTELPFETWQQGVMGVGIEEIVLPKSLKKIGDRAFSNSKLKTVTIPEGVTEIGSGVFGGCFDLGTVIWRSEAEEVNGSIGSMTDSNGRDDCAAGLGWQGPTLTIGENVKKIPANAFKDTPFTTVQFAQGSICTEIGASAFADCKRLTDITLPSSMQTIGANAFANCTVLYRFTLPSSVQTIGENAFEGCEKLVEINNQSLLEVTEGAETHGMIARYAKNVYHSPDGGMTKLFSWGEFIFYGEGNEYWLVGTGDDYIEEEMTLPDGVYQMGSKIATSYKLLPYAFANYKVGKLIVPSCVTAEGAHSLELYQGAGLGTVQRS